MRVLIVEDERHMATMLKVGMTREGMTVDTVFDGSAALEHAMAHSYDVVVLDRDLPIVHGDEVCRQLNAMAPQCRILMLTAAGRTGDKIAGLELGADDYLAKPFDFGELIARLRALHRRAAVASTPVLSFADLTLDTNRRTVYRAGREIRLTSKELAVLELLMLAEGAVRSQEYLLEKAWDGSVDPFTNAVRITISTLRRKLGEPVVIQTAINQGYQLRRQDGAGS